MLHTQQRSYPQTDHARAMQVMGAEILRTKGRAPYEQRSDFAAITLWFREPTPDQVNRAVMAWAWAAQKANYAPNKPLMTLANEAPSERDGAYWKTLTLFPVSYDTEKALTILAGNRNAICDAVARLARWADSDLEYAKRMPAHDVAGVLTGLPELISPAFDTFFAELDAAVDVTPEPAIITQARKMIAAIVEGC